MTSNWASGPYRSVRNFIETWHKTFDDSIVRQFTINYYLSEMTTKLFSSSTLVTPFAVTCFYTFEKSVLYFMRSETKNTQQELYFIALILTCNVDRKSFYFKYCYSKEPFTQALRNYQVDPEGDEKYRRPSFRPLRATISQVFQPWSTQGRAKTPTSRP